MCFHFWLQFESIQFWGLFIFLWILNQIVIESMSFPSRSDHRDRTRFSNQNARLAWVPKGSIQTAVETPSPNPNSNPNVVSGRNSSNSPAQHPRHFSNDNASSSVRKNWPYNQRRDDEREKDPNLPQLAQEIQEKLVKGTVECMICYDMVGRSAAIWSCSNCYSIFHLNCIKKWAKTPTSIDLSALMNHGFNWRCPGCQSVQLAAFKDIHYVCFCGKRIDPPSDLYLTPHSCGEPCGKQLDGTVQHLCPHRCVLQCHPGPCPPCKAFAPPRSCPCGKKVITTRCSDRSVLTCGLHCDKILDCFRHQCEKTCHVGPCDPCQIQIKASCFCRKKTEAVLCSDMSVKAEEGVFSCNSTCGKMLCCGNHFCFEPCHPGPCGDCALMPGKVNSCYCGKRSLQVERNSCLDPIENCSKTCDKILPCGDHRCKAICHGGDCPPCLCLIAQKCRCGSTSRTMECYKSGENFTCEKPCGRKKFCGRHRCSERCCPLSNPVNVHFCQMTCGKKLRCGQHNCENLCHSGHCPPCLETIFTDLTCACGKTSIPPPLPCGTPIPLCHLVCSVLQPCGHTATHSCHFGDCPPCSVPIAKECAGGHVVLGNIPCGSKDIRCGRFCGRTRQCGLHVCLRKCHPPPCDPPEHGSKPASCGQTCNAPRRDCRHTCTALCHPSVPCPDVRCEFPVTITCSCGRISASVPCHTDFEASVGQMLPVPLQPVESAGKRIPLGQRKLVCNDECAKLEHNSPNFEALHLGENNAVAELEWLGDLYRRDPVWVLAVEERFKYLVLSKNRGSASALKVHIFAPMPKDKRDAVRLIAERWKLAIYAAGWEPKRFIVVHSTPKSKAPSQVIGIKGTSAPNLPVFDPLVDMDPRLVVSFLDLPRGANIRSLVLRFGGECELVWLNEKNALAVFNDPARAATAMRRLDHGSVYRGAVSVLATAAKEGAAAGSRPWKKAVDSWDCGAEWTQGSIDVQASAWRGKESPIASVNRWNLLDLESGSSSYAKSVESSASVSELNDQLRVVSVQEELANVVDDWEKVCDSEDI